jgi:predicted nucleotidyltransferase
MPRRTPWSDRNPKAARSEYREVLALARDVAATEMARGGSAVILAGSWARRDAHRHSDVDLWVVGPARSNSFRAVRGRLVSVARKTSAQFRSELRSPRLVGTVVPAWRAGIILEDRRGIARRLQREAARFRWSTIGARCDRYVARSLTEWAEEAVKLTRLLADGRPESAAVQRNLLADALAGLVAVDRRMFYDENGLWEGVGRRMGATWHRHQSRALGLGGASLEESCRSALDLYRATAAALAPRLSTEQRRVVERAAERIR